MAKIKKKSKHPWSQWSTVQRHQTTAYKIGATIAELKFPLIYDPKLLGLKRKEEQNSTHVNHNNKESYKKSFSKEELARAIQVTKNSAPGLDKIHNEMLKHIPPKRLDSFLALNNKLWQQGYFPAKW